MNDHRVGRGNIQPRFHDGRRQKHVKLAVIESVHLVVELPRRHLAMGHDDRNLGHLIGQPVLDLGQIADAWDNKERLPAAIVFAQKRLAERHRVELADIGADRQTVDRRRADDREIAHTG